MSAADIFGIETGFYTFYDVTVQVRDRLVGGVPSEPSVIRSWLESRLQLGDPRLEELFEATVAARDEVMTVDQKLDALMSQPGAVSINGFKRRLPGGELIFEGRCVKSMLKEAANSVYPGIEWDGKKNGNTVKPGIAPKKGLKSTLAESVTVVEDMIGLGVKEPSRIEERIKHIMGPQGPRSAINRVEVVDAPRLEFTVKIRADFLTVQAWSKIWQAAEEIGLGADRARSDGRFDLTGWQRRS